MPFVCVCIYIYTVSLQHKFKYCLPIYLRNVKYFNELDGLSENGDL